MLVTVEDNKVTSVRPAPGYPFNRGRWCVKGANTVEMMYHPDRLLDPLKRDGERGSNKWKKVSWDEALDDIVSRLDKIRTDDGPEAIAIGQGTGRHHYMHVIRFANSLGTPNWYEPGLANCFIPRITVSYFTYGGFPVPDYYSDTKPETIIFWGHNPLVTSADGDMAYPAQDALNKGSFGIAIDPRRSETARKCKLWLPIRPGTDDALALAMIHVIIYDNIYDHDFVEKWTFGFDELKAHVKDYTPEWAARITTIPAKDIIEAAHRYAENKPSVLDWGVSIEQNPNCLQTVRALSILRGLVGCLDVPGGDLLGMSILNPYPTLKKALPHDAIQKRLGADKYKLLGGFRSFFPSAHIPSLYKAMRDGDPYRIKALLLFGTNPLLTVANTRNTYESLLKLDLLVATDHFMTPTAALADYVLPAAFWPELNQLILMPFVAENAVFAQHQLVQTGNCRQDEEIMIDLARRLNLPNSEESLENILNQQLEPIGKTFEQMKQEFMVYPEHKYRKYEEKGFRTSAKKVELYSKSLEKIGYDPLPTFQEPPESPVSAPEIAEKYPFVLTTGARRPEYFHTANRQIETLRKRRPDPIAEIHPKTAEKRGISNGDWIYVKSPRGQIRMKALVTEDIKENTVSIDHGWWFPEKDGPDYGLWESNANILTSDESPYDPGFGTYQLRGLLCDVEKIQ